MLVDPAGTFLEHLGVLDLRPLVEVAKRWDPNGRRDSEMDTFTGSVSARNAMWVLGVLHSERVWRRPSVHTSHGQMPEVNLTRVLNHGLSVTAG